jgi:hypothetical protein
MYTFVDFTSEIAGEGGSLVPQTRGSHTPIWCADHKNRLLLVLKSCTMYLLLCIIIFIIFILYL